MYEPHEKILAKFINPNGGWEGDKKQVKIHDLILNSYYQVESIRVGRSSSEFTIKGLKGSFNTVQFKFYNEKLEPINIYEMEEFNTYCIIPRQKSVPPMPPVKPPKPPTPKMKTKEEIIKEIKKWEIELTKPFYYYEPDGEEKYHMYIESKLEALKWVLNEN